MTYDPGKEWLRRTTQEVVTWQDAKSVLLAIGCTQVTVDWGTRLMSYLDINTDRRVRKIAEPGSSEGWTLGAIIAFEMKRPKMARGWTEL